LQNYTGKDYWQCRYIRSRYSSVCRTKREKCVLWESSWYHWMYNVINEVSHKPRSL